MEQTEKKRNVRKIVIWAVVAVLVLFCAGSMVAVKLIFDDTFSRGELSPYAAGLRYADVKDEYSRSPRQFYSGENRLQAYVYGEENDKGLVVISHGMGGGHEGYMTDICWFVDHGWRVFGFDNTGSCESEGDGIVGLVQSALDLDAALTFIEGDSELSKLDVLLYGHSWGGYAVAAVLNFDHDVAAVASIAGYNDPVDMAVEWGKDSMGGFAYLEYPFIWLNNKLIFGSLSDMTAVDGINRVDTPVLVIHGAGDKVVGYDGAGIIAQRDEITNPNVRFLTLDREGSDGHNTVFMSSGAVKYFDEIEKEYDKLEASYDGEVPDEVNEQFFSAVDKKRTSELNPDLIEAVEEFFEEAIAA